MAILHALSLLYMRALRTEIAELWGSSRPPIIPALPFYEQKKNCPAQTKILYFSKKSGMIITKARKQARRFFMGASILWAAAGTGFTFLMTTLGAAYGVFLPQKSFREFSKGISRVRRRCHDRGVCMVAFGAGHRGGGSSRWHCLGAGGRRIYPGRSISNVA